MNKIILFLPDFIGHPICFKNIVLSKSTCAEFISYHNFDSYNSIQNLADAIYRRLKSKLEQFDLINLVGYSFGGVVGFELSNILNENKKVNHLTLIDSHLILKPCKKDTSKEYYKIEHILSKYNNFLFILDLIELGEVKKSVIEKNLNLFESYAPSVKLKTALLFTSNMAFRNDTSTSIWNHYIRDLETKSVDSLHEYLLSSEVIKTHIQNIL